MGESLPDIDALSGDDLKKPVVEVFEANAALRGEIARLKGLKGRPKLWPSGMEPRDRAAAATPSGTQAPRQRRQDGEAHHP